MSALPLVGETYIISAAVGFVFVSLGLVMGGFARGGHGHGGHIGHGHLGGHGGHIAGGHGAGVHAGGHASGPRLGTGGHSGAAGPRLGTGGHAPGSAGHAPGSGGHAPGSGGHAPGSGGHAPGSGQASSHNAGVRAGNSGQGAANEMVEGQTTLAPVSQNPAMVIFSIFNPTTLATFLWWFGFAGIICWRLLPIPIEWTIAPALVVGFFLTNWTLTAMGWVMSRLFSSTNFAVTDLIGWSAEVSTVIRDGHLGEITYVVGGKRYTAPAKTNGAGAYFKAGTKVMIADVAEGDIFFVEPWLDEGALFDSRLQEQPEKDNQPPIPPNPQPDNPRSS